MDRIILYVNGNVMYDNGAEFTIPKPPLPPVDHATAPGPVFDAGVLSIDGQPYPFPQGNTTFKMPVVGGSIYLLETAECYKLLTVTVTHADGRPVLEPVTDKGGHVYVRFQALATETLNVNVSAPEQGGDIERHTS